jgi:hypothetical protein
MVGPVNAGGVKVVLGNGSQGLPEEEDPQVYCGPKFGPPVGQMALELEVLKKASGLYRQRKGGSW